MPVREWGLASAHLAPAEGAPHPRVVPRVVQREVPIMISRLALALVGVCALLAPTACAGQAPAPPPAGPKVPAYGAKLQPELEQLAREMLVTGAVVQVHSPDLGDWTTTIGTRTFRGTEPVQVDDHVRIGSVTKTWT